MEAVADGAAVDEIDWGLVRDGTEDSAADVFDRVETLLQFSEAYGVAGCEAEIGYLRERTTQREQVTRFCGADRHLCEQAFEIKYAAEGCAQLIPFDRCGEH